MKQIITLVVNDMRMAFQERSTWLFTFLMPVVFTAILALGGGGGAEDSRVPILLVNEDGGEAAERVEAALHASPAVRLFEPEGDIPLPADRASALADLATYTRVVILPEGMSEALARGERVEAELHLDPDHEIERTRAVQQALQQIFTAQNGALQAAEAATREAEKIRPFDSPAERRIYFESALAAARARLSAAPIEVTREVATSLEVAPRIATGAEQSSPGQLVTFTLVTLFTTSSVLVYERRIGTLRRLLTCPVGTTALLTGKVLGRFLLGLLQMGLLILVGSRVFDVPWGQSPLALAAMVVAFALAAVAIGLFFATVARTSHQAAQLASGAAMLIAAVGGAWWSLELMGGPMRTIAFLLPSGWAMDGFQDIILRGASLSDVLPNVGVLLGFATFFFLLGVWRFEYE